MYENNNFYLQYKTEQRKKIGKPFLFYHNIYFNNQKEKKQIYYIDQAPLSNLLRWWVEQGSRFFSFREQHKFDTMYI